MLKNWFNTFKVSVSQPKNYGELSTRKFWSGYWYLFLLIFLGVLLKMVMFTSEVVRSVPKVKAQLPQVKTQMLNAYPAELVVNIKNGTATTNVQEPYIISLQQIIPQLTNDEKTKLLVIDTDASVENYPLHKTLFFLTKNSLVYPARNNAGANSYEVFPLSEIKEPVTLDRPLYNQLITQVLPFVDKVPQFMYGFAIFALLFFPLLGGFAVLHGILFYLLILTLVLLLVSKLMKRNFTYKTLFKASMYGITVPLTLTFFADLLKLQIPGLYNLAFLGWMICVLTLNRAPVYTKNNAKSTTVPSRKTLSSRSRGS